MTQHAWPQSSQPLEGTPQPTVTVWCKQAHARPRYGAGSGAAQPGPEFTGSVNPRWFSRQSGRVNMNVPSAAAPAATQGSAQGSGGSGGASTIPGAPAAGSAKVLTATSVRIDVKVNGACPTTVIGGGFNGGGSPKHPAGGSGTRRTFGSATGAVNVVSGSTVLLPATRAVAVVGQCAGGAGTGASLTGDQASPNA
jgi:hypothetical protein